MDPAGNITDLVGYKTYEKNLTINDALAAPNLLSLSKQMGEAELVKRLYTVIAEGIAPFKVSNPMNERDILTTALDVLGSFGTDTLEDLILCFKSARLGLYGQIYNRLDGPTILGWLRKYLETKYQAKEDQLHNSKTANNDITGTDDPRALAMLSKIRKGIEARNTAAEPKPKANGSLEGWIAAIEKRAGEISIAELKAIHKQLVQSNYTGAVTNELTRIDKLIKNAISKEKKE